MIAEDLSCRHSLSLCSMTALQSSSQLVSVHDLIFMFVQTGAGKTYTMSGESQQFSRRGITPRALHQIFEQADIAVDRQTTVKVSFVEVYNEVSKVYLV